MAANANFTVVPKYPLTSSAFIGVIASADAHPAMTPPMLMDYSNSANGQDITGFRYKILNGNLFIENNNSFPVNVRYFLSADDETPPTTGGVNVIEEKSDTGVPYFLIKRPGSSDTAPSLNDILIDTRLSALRIVASGYITRAQFNLTSSNPRYGDIRHNVAHANPDNGYKTFVIYRALLETGICVEAKTVHLFSSFNFVGTGRGHSVCVMNETSTDFYLSTNNASYRAFSSAQGGLVDVNLNDRVVGIRYYIFAIPN
jgi:hypothetical protein